jgi:2-keto-4-pentenoate hydratase
LNVPAVQQQLGIDAPVIGHLTSATLIEPRSAHSMSGGKRVGVEPEVAIHVQRAVEGAAAADRALDAIAALGPAIEIVDIDASLRDVQSIVAANVFHRGVLLGSPSAGRDLHGMSAQLLIDGAPAGQVVDVARALDLGEIVSRVADLLASAGERLEPGDVIISGSVTPIAWVEPGSEATLELGRLGSLGVTFVE